MGKSENILLRVEPEEKKGFQLAAEISGITLSNWMRERLRLAAIRELEGAGLRAPFLPSIPIGDK